MLYPLEDEPIEWLRYYYSRWRWRKRLQAFVPCGDDCYSVARLEHHLYARFFEQHCACRGRGTMLCPDCNDPTGQFSLEPACGRCKGTGLVPCPRL